MKKRLELSSRKIKQQSRARKNRKIVFLNNDVIKQYPNKKYMKLVSICVDIAINFLITLEDGFDYNSTSIASYGEKYGSSQRNTSSRVESILIKNMESKEKMKDFLDAFFNTYNNLNSEEQIIFNAVYFEHLTEEEITREYHVNSNYVVQARRSATIKFCLKSGLDRFINLV